MRLLTPSLVLLGLACCLAACDQFGSKQCFDDPDAFAAQLEKDANASIPKGATVDQVRQYCKQKGLLFVERDFVIYCTAEQHRGMSRCDASVDFELASDRTVRAVSVEEPRIKNP
jgi:hypothetical protein